MQGIIVVCKINKNIYYIMYVVFSAQNITKKTDVVLWRK